MRPTRSKGSGSVLALGLTPQALSAKRVLDYQALNSDLVCFFFIATLRQLTRSSRQSSQDASRTVSSRRLFCMNARNLFVLENKSFHQKKRIAVMRARITLSQGLKLI